jgi:hypothetical protein
MYYIVLLLDKLHSTVFMHLSEVCEACVTYSGPVLSVATFMQIFSSAEGLGQLALGTIRSLTLRSNLWQTSSSHSNSVSHTFMTDSVCPF